MFDLFNPPPDSFESLIDLKTNDTNLIDGLIYIPNFISKVEALNYIKAINEESWLSDIKRRVQHYGYKYNYKFRAIDYSMFLGPLPKWASSMAERLYSEKYIDVIPDQLIINEYESGQGIANHIDCEPCFGDTVISISLGSSCIMDFINVKTKQKIEVLLEPGSLVAIRGDARYKWTHGIAQRKTDTFNGIKIERKLRISMTFRKVILR